MKGPVLTGRRFGPTLVVFLALALLSCRGAETATTSAPVRQTAPQAEAPHATAEPSRGFGPSIGFHSRRQLAEHFEKHGREFGAPDAREYLREAQRLRDAPAGGPILELVREDGTVTRFDRGTGAFIAFDEDGTIRTFFKPNLGEEYFRRQARRHEDRR